MIRLQWVSSTWVIITNLLVTMFSRTNCWQLPVSYLIEFSKYYLLNSDLYEFVWVTDDC